MALSMEEQRILDEMERNLAADDPRFASRLGAFGRPRHRSSARSARIRAITGILALALISAVALLMFAFSPFGRPPGGAPGRSHHAAPAAARVRPSSGLAP